jgi:hypothetical protein
MNVYTVRAFVKLREMLLSNREVAQKLANLERSLLTTGPEHPAAIQGGLRSNPLTDGAAPAKTTSDRLYRRPTSGKGQ